MKVDDNKMADRPVHSWDICLLDGPFSWFFAHVDRVSRGTTDSNTCLVIFYKYLNTVRCLRCITPRIICERKLLQVIVNRRVFARAFKHFCDVCTCLQRSGNRAHFGATSRKAKALYVFPANSGSYYGYSRYSHLN